MKIINILLAIISLVGLLVVFLSRKKYTYIKPTSDYYIYDSNNYLLSSTKYSIYLNSKELFEQTKSIKQIGGTQIVIVALSHLDNSNSTTIFNEWEIGLNDMGILIILYFDDSDIPTLTGYGYEAGANMMGHLTAFTFNDLADKYLLPFQNEVNIMTLYYELLNTIYTKIYGYNSFTYDIDNYIDIMYNSYYSKLPSSNKNSLLFDGYSPFKIILSLIFGVSSVGNMGLFFLNKGQGGKSLGYKYRRWNSIKSYIKLIT